MKVCVYSISNLQEQIKVLFVDKGLLINRFMYGFLLSLLLLKNNWTRTVYKDAACICKLLA